MCGLVGVAGTTRHDDVKAFKDLLLISALRGIDSTGIAIIPCSGRERPLVIKSVGNSFDFLDRRAVDLALSPGSQVLMGHTRWRTVGEVNKANAQPIEYDNMIGTHNGTLSYSAKGLLEGKHNNFTTDSLALYYHIDKFGLKSALDQMDDKDAAALVWVSPETNTLHMYRNQERPLFFAFNDKRDALYWASEAGMLYFVLNHNNIGFKKVQRLEPFKHFSIELPTALTEVFGKPSVVELKMKPHIVYGKINHATYSYSADTGQSVIPFTSKQRVFGANTNPSTDVSVTASGSNNVSSIDAKLRSKWRADTLQPRAVAAGGPFYKTYRGQILDEDAFTVKSYQGCALNGEIPEFGEPVKFLNDDSFLCGNCLALAVSGADPETTATIEMML